MRKYLSCGYCSAIFSCTDNKGNGRDCHTCKNPCEHKGTDLFDLPVKAEQIHPYAGTCDKCKRDLLDNLEAR